MILLVGARAKIMFGQDEMALLKNVRVNAIQRRKQLLVLHQVSQILPFGSGWSQQLPGGLRTQVLQPATVSATNRKK